LPLPSAASPRSTLAAATSFSEQMHHGCGPAHTDFIAKGIEGKRDEGRKNSSVLVR